jgi:RNA polymerase-interacting CarD/CdnL/TRCF family regulator
MDSSKVARELAVIGRPRGRSELERQVLKRATALLECEEAACLTAGEGQAGFARFRAILHLERVVSLRAAAAGAAS